jgi:hypothetical protein
VDGPFQRAGHLPAAAFAAERGGQMFVPFYSAMFLAFESGNVIGLRMVKMMSGGSGSHDEVQLMVTEKVSALFEASASLMAGGTASGVVDRYREHVAANAKRLSHQVFGRSGEFNDSIRPVFPDNRELALVRRI